VTTSRAAPTATSVTTAAGVAASTTMPSSSWVT
jgi:hypothetical protein